MDYATVKGVYQRTGVKKEDLLAFVLKELLDNAIDFVEQYGRASKHVIKVILRKGNITVANSNFGIEPSTQDMVNSIFNFDKFYSEKRNIYRVLKRTSWRCTKGNTLYALCVSIIGTDRKLERANDNNWQQIITFNTA